MVAFEERVFDSILEDMQRRGNTTMEPVLVINLVRPAAAAAQLQMLFAGSARSLVCGWLPA